MNLLNFDSSNGLGKLQRFTQSPFYKAIFWILAFILAGYISVRASSLAAVTLSWDKPIHWELIILTISIIVLGIMVALSAQANETRTLFITNSQLTSPPPTIYQEFSKYYARHNSLFMALISSDATTSSKLRLVRQILSTIVVLAQKWDQPNTIRTGKVIYRANIMHVFYHNELQDGYNQAAYDRLAKSAECFAFKTLTTHYHGIVGLINNLMTTSTLTPEPEVDQDRKPIGLPFALYHGHQNYFHVDDLIHNNLLGAPSCVTSKACTYIKSPKEILNSYITGKAVKDDIKKHIAEYYLAEENRVAHSILSMPILESPINFWLAQQAPTAEVPESSEEDTIVPESSEEDTVVPESSEEDTVVPESSEEDTVVPESSEEELISSKDVVESHSKSDLVNEENALNSDIDEFDQKYIDHAKVSYVVNIYRNQDGMLFNGIKSNDFNDMIRPYTILLGQILDTISPDDIVRTQ